jgi:hypothetical protein
VEEIPLLIPIRTLSTVEWTTLFAAAIPKLYQLAQKINGTTEWSAQELLAVMSSATHNVPYLDINASRLAVRWLSELIPALQIPMSDYNLPIDVEGYRVASRLGIINPHNDKYFGEDSPADRKIQALAKRLFPDTPWYLAEPLSRTGQQAVRGGQCSPSDPTHSDCMFEAICPKLYVDRDPATIGIDVGGRTSRRRLNKIHDFVLTERTRGKGKRRISTDDRRDYRDLWLHALTTGRTGVPKKSSDQ